MLIYVNITDRRTDKHIESIVQNPKKGKKKLHTRFASRTPCQPKHAPPPHTNTTAPQSQHT